MSIEHPDHQDVNALGELPRQMREERRELYGREPEAGGPPGIISEIPGSPQQIHLEHPLMPRPRDVRGGNAALLDAELAPAGQPAVDFLVQTTFDARPINGNDWQFFDVLALDPNGDLGPAVFTQTLSFRVPDGRVAIIRHLNWFSNQVLVQPAPAPGDPITDLVPMFVTLAVSGFVQRTYERIFQQEGERTVYAIAFEKETIDVRVTINTAFTGSILGYTPGFFIEMQGNLLDTRGREKQYEPANQYVRGILK